MRTNIFVSTWIEDQEAELFFFFLKENGNFFKMKFKNRTKEFALQK